MWFSGTHLGKQVRLTCRGCHGRLIVDDVDVVSLLCELLHHAAERLVVERRELLQVEGHKLVARQLAVRHVQIHLIEHGLRRGVDAIEELTKLIEGECARAVVVARVKEISEQLAALCLLRRFRRWREAAPQEFHHEGNGLFRL
jgi:hypothetical protein